MNAKAFAGAVLLWLGYTMTWWGWERIGGNVDLMDLIVPGRVATFRSTHGSSVPPAAIGNAIGRGDVGIGPGPNTPGFRAPGNAPPPLMPVPVF